MYHVWSVSPLEYGESDSVWPLKLGHKSSLFPAASNLASWISYSGGSQLPRHESSTQEASWRKNEDSWPTASANLPVTWLIHFRGGSASPHQGFTWQLQSTSDYTYRGVQAEQPSSSQIPDLQNRWAKGYLMPPCLICHHGNGNGNTIFSIAGPQLCSKGHRFPLTALTR